jgi:branched-chain amino acid transport system permease protein
MIMLINLTALFYGSETKIIISEISPSVKWGGIILTYNQLWQFTVSSVILLLTFLLLNKSGFGRKARALRDDSELFMIMGYDIYKMRAILFILSGIYAALGANLIAMDVGMDPYVGMPMLLNAIVALIIGGAGKFEAPVLGGFIIGILQASTVWLFSARWQDAVVFLILILFLVFRPQGILGEKKRFV